MELEMDKAPLNKAHQLERKAQVLSRQKKVDDCIQCHLEIVELYNKYLNSDGDKNALESIRLQKEANERQIRMLQLKKSFLERAEREKKLNKVILGKHNQKEAVENLEAKIFENFETHDSLIAYLAHRGIIDNRDRDCQSILEEVDEQDGSPFIIGNKLPKDDSTIIEELKELSGQLRESVQGLLKLLIKLGERKQQNERIKERIKRMDLDQIYKEGLLIQLDDRNKEIEQLKVQIHNLELEKSHKDDSSGATSPMVMSCPTDFDEEEVPELPTLPHLDPIAVPEIDLSVFKQFRMPNVNQKVVKTDTKEH
ncbi:nuclear receptor-binding factor 2-like isoform X2 [Euwallacea fornicatus]|uniref:nuclear receptor-binding factor 2-like isoform X2 n=1 Tax=Euwallacea fornicatus TaxID=995702 RepID=UPI00338F2C8F